MADDAGTGERSAPVGLFVGVTVLDAIYRVPRPPGPNEKLRALSQEFAAGGPAANAAVAFAALGGRARLLTVLGTHPFALLAASDLIDHGVELLDVAPERRQPPGLASVYITPSGERTVVSTADDGQEAVPPPDLDSVVAAGDVLLLDGYHPALARAAAAAAPASLPVILDGGSFKPVLNDLFARLDVAACSADFRFPSPDEVGTSPPDIAAELLARRVGAAVITCGSEPTQWWQADRHGAEPAPAVDAVDTLAAGDVFHGALAYARASRPQHELAWQISFANSVAAIKCRTSGARAWLADPALRVAVDRWLEASGHGRPPAAWFD